MGIVVKNVVVLGLVLSAWLALSVGYLSPDRPTRDQWERLEKARKGGPTTLVYQSNFSVETPGVEKQPAGYWGFYNGATVSTVQYDPGGVTVTYGGTPWIGAVLHFKAYERLQIYRVTFERSVDGEPAAVIVRNRQMDLMRQEIPVGTGPTTVYFVAPQGSLDRVYLAFIPDGRDKPVGKLRITSLKIERMLEQGAK
ncbi:MAG: hypothetical protein ACKVP7_20575 [Hyphomicrobiaceae bacterium]